MGRKQEARGFIIRKQLKKKVSDSQFLKILEKGDATQKAESLWNAGMSEKVTRRPRECGKKERKSFLEGVGVPLGSRRTEMKDPERASAEHSAWESLGEREQVGVEELRGRRGDPHQAGRTAF